MAAVFRKNRVHAQIDKMAGHPREPDEHIVHLQNLALTNLRKERKNASQRLDLICVLWLAITCLVSLSLFLTFFLITPVHTSSRDPSHKKEILQNTYSIDLSLAVNQNFPLHDPTPVNSLSPPLSFSS
jgi:hypothetical protein